MTLPTGQLPKYLKKHSGVPILQGMKWAAGWLNAVTNPAGDEYRRKLESVEAMVLPRIKAFLEANNPDVANRGVMAALELRRMQLKREEHLTQLALKVIDGLTEVEIARMQAAVHLTPEQLRAMDQGREWKDMTDEEKAAVMDRVNEKFSKKGARTG